MQKFVHIVRDPLGIHARPAGMLAKEAQNFPDTAITIEKDGKTAGAGQLLKLMGLGIRQGDAVTVTVQGPSEEAAIQAMQLFFSEHL